VKILFLDFDGVISTNRAWLANKLLGIDDFYDRWIDPMAVAMIADICEQFDYTIVVTSTWRNFGYQHCHRALGMAAQYLHADWRTKEIWPKGPNSSAGSRPAEIADWLSRYEVEDYIIVDDDSFNWLPDQRERWVKTDQLNGITTENYEDVMNRNGK
jgi:hypothetical protein